jgi:hypothetical protein
LISRAGQVDVDVLEQGGSRLQAGIRCREGLGGEGGRNRESIDA